MSCWYSRGNYRLSPLTRSSSAKVRATCEGLELMLWHHATTLISMISRSYGRRCWYQGCTDYYRGDVIHAQGPSCTLERIVESNNTAIMTKIARAWGTLYWCMKNSIIFHNVSYFFVLSINCHFSFYIIFMVYIYLDCLLLKKYFVWFFLLFWI